MKNSLYTLARAASFVLGLLLAGTALALDINIRSGDGPGEGFNDPTEVAPVGGNTGTTLGEQRMRVFERAAEIWGTALNGTVAITVDADFLPMGCNANSAILGGAGPTDAVANFPNAPQLGTWYHVALANNLAGSDQSSFTDAEIGATFNSAIDNNDDCLFNTNWYLGLDNNSGGDIDLLAVVLHEFGHGLGFSTLTNEENGQFALGIPDIYAHFILDNTSGLHWTEMNNAQRQASATNSGNLVWDGGQVTAASGPLISGKDGSGRVKLYAPNPTQGGSSISHWDNTASPNLLMEPFITSTLGSDLDLTDEQMGDIGWSTASGPVCGNGIKEAGEACDGPDLGGATCGDFGCGGGTLLCTPSCTIDDSLCTDCGGSSCTINGTCESGEICGTCADCISGEITGAECGNGICEAGDGENCVTCPGDCAGKQNGRPSDRFCCGAPGGTNNQGCNQAQCGNSCTFDPAPGGGSYCCGDGTCNGEENSLNCALDCGSCSVSESPETTCDDGLDNDCDGDFDTDDTDCQGGQCIPAGKEKGKRCSDGIDNDCDGDIDGADSEC